MSDSPEKVMPPPDLDQCAICARHFFPERLQAHEAICQASSAITRKCFDISEQLLKGSDTGKQPVQEQTENCQKSKRSGLNTNWRRKHEEFMQMIKDAKEKNEKLHGSVLSESSTVNEDMESIQCQYCLRPYSKLAAARHMSICAWKNDFNMQKNI